MKKEKRENFYFEDGMSKKVRLTRQERKMGKK
jgi:hypothetical protein